VVLCDCYIAFFTLKMPGKVEFTKIKQNITILPACPIILKIQENSVLVNICIQYKVITVFLLVY